jgi:hypothetical protein
VAIENVRLFKNVETSLEDLRTTQDRLEASCGEGGNRAWHHCSRAAARRDQRATKTLQTIRELGPFLDRAAENLRKGLIALKENAPVVGRDFRHVQMPHRCLMVAFFDTPFRDAFGVPDANDRRSFSTFSGVVSQWCDVTDNALRNELASLDGAPQKDEAA